MGGNRGGAGWRVAAGRGRGGGCPDTRRNRPVAAAVLLVATPCLAACGNPTPLPSGLPPGPVPLHSAAVLCGARTSAAPGAPGTGPASGREAMRRYYPPTTVTVDAGRGASACTVLELGQPTALLRVGDRAQFVANAAPDVTAHGPDPVRVSTAHGPATDGGGLVTAHVVVTLTAVRPGTASVAWVDCSGVAC